MHETIRKHLVSCNFKKRCLSIWLFAFSGLTLCRSSLNILLQTLTDRRLFLLFLCVPTTHLCQKEIDTPWVRFVYQTTENITGLIGRRSVEILMCIGKLLSFQRANSQSCFSQKKPFWHALACNAGARNAPARVGASSCGFARQRWGTECARARRGIVLGSAVEIVRKTSF